MINTTDHTTTVTVQEAINRGLKTIYRPAKIISVSAVALCILLMVLHFSWAYLLLIPLGVLCSVLYIGYATPGWKVWAYRHVNDIHQLQRSAELAGLLKIQSYQTREGEVIEHREEPLRTLLKRFQEDPGFIDDPAIPAETRLYGNDIEAYLKPVIILNDSGIQVRPEGFFTWGQVANERIAQVSYRHISAYTGAYRSSGSKKFFRFECLPLRYEISLASLSIEAWKLDLLLYTYRGRYTLKQQKQNTL